MKSIFFILFISLTGCAAIMPAVRTANDVARIACEAYYSGRPNYRDICRAREVLDIFLAQVKEMDKATGIKRPE